MVSSRSFQYMVYALDVALLVFLLVFPSHAYEWMKNVDPSIEQLPADPLGDVRWLLALAALLFVGAMNVIGMVKCQQYWARMANGVLLGAASILWVWKFVVS